MRFFRVEPGKPAKPGTGSVPGLSGFPCFVSWRLRNQLPRGHGSARLTEALSYSLHRQNRGADRAGADRDHGEERDGADTRLAVAESAQANHRQVAGAAIDHQGVLVVGSEGDVT